MKEILEAFLLGVAAAASAVIALFFLRFWRSTRDALFLAFAASFGVEVVLRIARLAYVQGGQAGEGAPVMYAIRLLASLLILVAILRKNAGKSG